MSTTTTIQKTENAACGCESTSGGRGTSAVFRPAADILETQHAFLVRLDLPGATSEGIDLTVTGNELTITGRVAPRCPAGQPELMHSEYSVGDFVRTFRLGEGIDREGITASFDNGVLSLTLPKADSARTRKIQVNVN